MAVSITVITTANRARRFTQTDEASIAQLLESLKRSAQLFSGKPLIVGSAGQTEVFATSSIACIEIETRLDLTEHVAIPPNLKLTALTPEQSAEPFSGGLQGDHFTARIEFFFAGGHALVTLAEGVRKAALAERLMNLTSLFERPMVSYRLPHGGIGLMNPHAMTRFTITPGAPDLPSDAWLAEPA
ncbi:hypothetical protein [Accumulibacter sp.]|uniref:hypothetical protein n=1 Tax=Accumulibacter sp. TaxID=2053492 RepID=UPI0025EE89C1|nr:hypothetical protein [Accumulibacter sp.]MCM8596717.1 hypothetical protein [Accumulibacter sp.]MCM8624749.1 hypothetical protein [Accumulibacter sp.]MDS4050865.1 hypothetical protein [Accumulibacter sp.]